MSSCVCGMKSPASLLRATDRGWGANSVWLLALVLLASLGTARPVPAATCHLAPFAPQAVLVLVGQAAARDAGSEPPAVQPPVAQPPVDKPPGIERQGGQPAGLEQQTRADLDAVLAQPDFRRLRQLSELVPEAPQVPNSNLSTRFLRWLWNRFPSFPNGSIGDVSWISQAMTAIGWGIVALLVSAVIWLIIRAVNAYRWRLRSRFQPLPSFEEQTLELPPGDIPADEFRQRAEHLAQQQLFGEAIAQLLLGSMSQMERSELIRFRRGLTYRDYLRALRGHPAHRDAFRALVQTYLPVGFGRRPATATQYHEAAAGYDQSFAQPIPTALQPAAPVVFDPEIQSATPDVVEVSG